MTTSQKNDKNLTFFCPSCKEETYPNGDVDDAGTQFFKCKNGHQTSTPIKRQFDPLITFVLHFFEQYQLWKAKPHE